MSKQTESNLFMFSPLAVKQTRLYQQLLGGIASYEALGNRVIRDIKTAHAFRQVDRVRELSRILINIPIKEYQLIAQYYLVWCQCRQLKLHSEVLEKIADESETYKAKALLSLAGFEGLKGKLESELYFYVEALRASSNISDYIQATMGIAVVKAKEGSHKHALRDLENLVPIIHHTNALIYNDVLNSYAVELGESGRVYEARNISRLVLASPFAHAYPEWQETANELREANRSFVAALEVEHEHAEPQQSIPEQPARVYLFPKLQGDAPQIPKPQTISADELEEMSLAEMRAMLLSLAYDKDIAKDDYKRMIMASKIVQQEWPKEIDLESDSKLEEIILHWLNEETSPEQLTAVFSALRDCDSEFRRASIIDRIISIAYKESMSGQTSESEWREQFEAKLTPNPYKGL